jgi:predicted nucleic acid-binding Zn ribbon protein
MPVPSTKWMPEMDRKEIKKIDSLLDMFVKSNKLERGLAEYRLINSWRDLLGITVAKKTKNLQIRNRKLFVTLHSSVVRNELEMMKDTLIGKLNEAAGMNVIDDIVLR